MQNVRVPSSDVIARIHQSGNADARKGLTVGLVLAHFSLGTQLTSPAWLRSASSCTASPGTANMSLARLAQLIRRLFVAGLIDALIDQHDGTLGIGSLERKAF